MLQSKDMGWRMDKNNQDLPICCRQETDLLRKDVFFIWERERGRGGRGISPSRLTSRSGEPDAGLSFMTPRPDQMKPRVRCWPRCASQVLCPLGNFELLMPGFAQTNWSRSSRSCLPGTGCLFKRLDGQPGSEVDALCIWASLNDTEASFYSCSLLPHWQRLFLKKFVFMIIRSPSCDWHS